MYKVSVVLPCFNMVDYIEETLQSIVNQKGRSIHYEIELVVVDGGSTDGTLDIINRYTQHVNHILVGKDRGQYDAINLGFTYCTGDVFCWINADDVLHLSAFKTVVSILSNNPQVEWITGIRSHINESSELIRYGNRSITSNSSSLIRNGLFHSKSLGYLMQEGMFWTKSLWTRSGGLNIEYKYAADYDLWIRFSSLADLYEVSVPLASFRIRKNQRSASEKYIEEVIKVGQGVSWMSTSIITNNILFRVLCFGKYSTFVFDGGSWVLLRGYTFVLKYNPFEMIVRGIRVKA